MVLFCSHSIFLNDNIILIRDINYGGIAIFSLQVVDIFRKFFDIETKHSDIFFVIVAISFKCIFNCTKNLSMTAILLSLKYDPIS